MKFGHLASHEGKGQVAKSWDLALTGLWAQTPFLIGGVKRIWCASECVCVSVCLSPT